MAQIWAMAAISARVGGHQSLHILALDLADRVPSEHLDRRDAELTPDEREADKIGAVALTLKANHYDPANGRLALAPGVGAG